MTKEELDAFVKTEEGIKWMEPIVAGNLPRFTSPGALPGVIEEAKKGLLNKKLELETEISTLKTTHNTLKDDHANSQRYLNLFEDFHVGLDESGKPDYNKVEEVLKKVASGVSDPGAGASNADLVEVKRLLTKSQRDGEAQTKQLKLKDTDIESFKSEIEMRDTYINGLLVNDAFRVALGKSGYHETAIDMILPKIIAKSGAQVNYDDSKETNERWSATTDDGRSPKEWVDWWKATEEGLYFMPGRQNGGGGSQGSGTGGTAKSWEKMSTTEKTAIYRKDPSLYRKMQDNYRKMQDNS